MSIQIYQRAYNYVQKILSIYSTMDKCQGLSSTYATYYEKTTKFYRHAIFYKQRDQDIYKKLMGRKFENNPMKSHLRYWITTSGANSSHTSNRELICIYEFNEELDFQLSTIFNNMELFDYYVQCFLFTSGFRGFVNKGIDHQTINALQRHINVIYSDRKYMFNISEDSTYYRI